MKTDYEIIKDKYGERMAKACRTMFPTILEQNGVLSNMLLSKIYPNPTIYEDLVLGKSSSFKNYIYSLFNIENKAVETGKTAIELLSDAGYYLYECKSEEQIQSFKKYYAQSEELCTFNGQRLNDNYVFFAVKKNVDEIKRENFTNPLREDEYGTSVISIQFSKGFNNILSIKNRYNHTVNNPDATFSNNLENIIPGLTHAFEVDYNLNLGKIMNSKLDLVDYELANDNRLYKYNYKINDICYCPNNIIINNGQVIKADSSRYKIIDYFVLDYKEKSIEPYDKSLEESFVYNKLKRIDVSKLTDKKGLKFEICENEDDKINIEVDELSRINTLKVESKKQIPNNYLSNNLFLNKISINNTKVIGNNFLKKNEKISNLELNNTENIGDNFLEFNNSINKVNLPNIRRMGNYCFCYNDLIEEIFMPNIQTIGNSCFYYNEKNKKLSLPNVEQIGTDFFFSNDTIDQVYLPKLKEVGVNSFGLNTNIQDNLLEVIKKNDRRFNQETNTQNEQIESSAKRL